MKRELIVFIVLCLAAVMPANAEKKPKETKLSVLVKAANTAIKNKSGQDAAEKNLVAALTRTDLSEKDKAGICLLAAQLEESKNGVENTKAYLKQKYDTASLFSTLLNMYAHLQKCDSLDALPNAKGQVKIKYGGKTRSMRQKHRRNMLNGGRFFVSKGNYDVGYEYLDNYLTYKDRMKVDTMLQKVAYMATLCGYLTQKPMRTLKYVDEAISVAKAEEKPILQEYKVLAYQQLGDEASAWNELHRGVFLYPSHDYFFVHIVDKYYADRNFDKGLALADSLIALDASKPIYWYTKSKLELAENDYYKCIEYSDSTISRDTTFVDAYYNKGISYLNLALIEQESACQDMLDPKCQADRKRVQDLYQKARPCMESVRRLSPDNVERWGTPLYRIYMNLNMGKEFDEIDKLLHP